MDWNYIIALESRFTSWGFEPDLVGEHGYDGRLVTLNDLIVSRGGGPWKLDLSDFWSIPGQFLCEDVRDRVYGVLEIFDWEGNGMQKPKPNYETSVFDLALHLMSHTRDEHPVSAAIVIDLLELGKLLTRDLVAQYQASQHLKQPVDVDWYLWPHQPRGICLLRQDCLGRLSADLELAEEEEVESATEVSRLLKSAAQMDGANATALPFSNEQKPSQIYTGDTVSAIAWPEVKPGDILIQAGHFTFVIRQVANDSYFRVVAHAIKLSQFDYRVWEYWTCGCWLQEVKESVSNQGVLLAFTSLTHPEELIMGTFSDNGYTLSSRVVRGLLNIPPIGTLVEDASTDSWKAETWARSIEQSCTEHDAKESNRWRRKPIQFAAASGCGPALETVTI
ncbi:unnamed protein product [Cercospora beticola]|nr:unnamed protein product [Cercospora beticola]